MLGITHIAHDFVNMYVNNHMFIVVEKQNYIFCCKHFCIFHVMSVTIILSLKLIQYKYVQLTEPRHVTTDQRECNRMRCVHVS
jgi:hypothetical protein